MIWRSKVIIIIIIIIIVIIISIISIIITFEKEYGNTLPF